MAQRKFERLTDAGEWISVASVSGETDIFGDPAAAWDRHMRDVGGFVAPGEVRTPCRMRSSFSSMPMPPVEFTGWRYQ